jgi:hypothetical protein
MGKLTTVSVNVDFETIRTLTGMSDDQIEKQEGNIDFALDQAFRREFSEAEEVKASCGYASSVIVEAYDDNNDPTSIDDARVNNAIRNAVNSL